jgi:hypothetical protein
MKKILLTLAIVTLAVPAMQATAQDPAKIELNPQKIEMVAKQGDKAAAKIDIYNRGASTLLFTISKSYAKKAPMSLNSSGNLMVYPTFVDFGTVPNQGEVSQSITCTAPGEKYLSVTAISDVPWMKCLVKNIDTTVSTITVTVNLSELVAGQLYRGNVIVSSNAGLVQVPVILQVAVSSTFDWLAYNPPTGLIEAGQSTSVIITANTVGMSAGEYTATLLVTSTDPTQALIEVSVKLTITSIGPKPVAPEAFFGHQGDKRVHLFWTPSKSPDVRGYFIYRATYPGGYTNTPITDFYVSGISYTDSNVENGITYYYIIRSVDANNNMSDPSPEISVTPNPITPTTDLKDGAIYRTQAIEFKGKAEPNSQVIINGELVALNPDGTYTKTLVLKPGPNKIEVLIFDPVGNKTNLTYNVSFATVTTLIFMVGSKDINVNGVPIKNAMAVAPVIKNNRVFVPFRILGEKLGAEVGWEAATKKVTYKLEGRTIEMWIGNKAAMVNGKRVTVDPPPMIIGGSTMVPTRFISDNLGATTEWYAQSKTVAIRYPGK